MANVFGVNVYQIGANNVMARDAPLKIYFPTTGVLLNDCSTSPTRSLPSGYNVYSFITVPGMLDSSNKPTKYYVAETVSQLAVIVG